MTGSLRSDTPRLVPCLALVLVLLQLVLLPVPRSDGHLLGSDGGYAYSYMRSALLDGDVDIENDIALYNARVPPRSTAQLSPAYVSPIGSGVLWAPAFLVGHGASRVAAAVGLDVDADGFGRCEQAAVVLASVAYVGLGLFLLLGVTRRLVPGGRPGVAVAGTFLISPAAYYAVFEPTMSHAVEYFTVALFLHVVHVRALVTTRDHVVLGFAAGLLFLVRWQNAVLWVVGLPLLVDDLRSRRDRAWPWAGAAAAAAVVVSLQLAFWKATLGSYVTIPQGVGFLSPLEPQLTDVLLSTRHGLFAWHPGLVIAALGIALLRPWRVAAPTAGAILLALYVCSIASDWWGGDAFGMRRMTGTVPLLTLGTAAILAELRTPRRRAFAIVVLLGLAVWNVSLMIDYRLEDIPRSRALTFQELVLDRFTVPSRLLDKLR